MRECVIAHDVTSINNLTHDFGPLPNVAPDQKKSRLYIVFRKNLKQAHGMRIIRTIVES